MPLTPMPLTPMPLNLPLQVLGSDGHGFSPWLFGPAFSFSHQEVAADFRKSRYFAARQNSEAEPYGITGAPKSS